MDIPTIVSVTRAAIAVIGPLIHGLDIPATDRTRFAAACFHQAQEHADAVRLLVDRAPAERLSGSALALVRPTFESYIRGLWLLHCATAEQLHAYTEHDELRRNMDQVLQDIESMDGFNVGVLSAIKGLAWTHMCSFTHSGRSQTVRRITEDSVAPNYADELIVSAVTMTTLWSLLSCAEVVAMANRADIVPKILEQVRKVNRPADEAGAGSSG